MAENAQWELENWCMCLSSEETEQYMKALGPRVDGKKFAKLERLSQWLSGNYEPDDFVVEPEIEGVHAQWVHRTFMDRASGSNPDLSWASTTKDERHPLELVKVDPEVAANLEQSTIWVASMAKKHDEMTEASHSELDDTNANELGQKVTRNVAPGMLLLQQSSGAEFQIPMEFAVYMAEMNKKMDRLEESIQALSMRSNPHPRSNSTRLDGAENPGRQVNFQDTTFTYPRRQSPPPTQSTARRGTRLSAQDSHVPLPGNPAQHRQSLGSAYRGGGAQSRIAQAIDTTQWHGEFYSGPTPPNDGQGGPRAGNI